MEDFIVSDQGFVEAHIEDLESLSMAILNTVRNDCPLFTEFQSQVRSKLFEFEESQGWNLLQNHPQHPLPRLNRYVHSLETICWHIMYSFVRLNVLAEWVHLPGGQSSLVSYYISYYFFDCISRGKAVVDILGLMINHTFGLGVYKERCGLDRGAITAALARIYDGSKEQEYVDTLCRDLDRRRNDWLSDFYKLRNMIVHRHEFGALAVVTICVDNNGSPEGIHPFSVLFRETTEPIDYIKSIAPNSVFADYSVDPILFYAGLWNKLASLIECVCEGCHPHIAAFVSSLA